MINPLSEPSTDKWNASLIRYTLFPSQMYEINNDWWNKLFETPPDNFNFNRKINIFHFDGEFQFGLMNLDISPLRIDFNFISPKSNSPSELSDFNLGLFEDVVKVFSSVILKFLQIDNCPPAQRIAFGSNCFIATESRISGYELMDNYLPNIDIDAENSRDFLYQINRRRQSKVVDKLSINRLSKWRVIEHGFLPIPNGGQTKQPLLDFFEKEFSLNLDLDINTQPDYTSEFTPTDQEELLAELIELTREILLDGDIR